MDWGNRALPFSTAAGYINLDGEVLWKRIRFTKEAERT